MRRWGLFFLTVWGLKLHGRTNRLFLSHNDVCHDTNTSAFGCRSPWMKLPTSDGFVMPQWVVTLWADDSPCAMLTAQQSCSSLYICGLIIAGRGGGCSPWSCHMGPGTGRQEPRAQEPLGVRWSENPDTSLSAASVQSCPIVMVQTRTALK